MNEHIPETEFAERRRRLSERDAAPGHRRAVRPAVRRPRVPDRPRARPAELRPALGYAHGWVAGAFIVPDAEPLFVLPRMIVAFHLWDGEPENLVTVNEADDGSALFARAAASLGEHRPRSASARAPGARP